MPEITLSIPMRLQRLLIEDATAALVKTWHNGNRSDVVAAVQGAPDRIALALAVGVAASLADRRIDREDSDLAEALLESALDFGGAALAHMTHEQWFAAELRYQAAPPDCNSCDHLNLGWNFCKGTTCALKAARERG